MPRGGQTQPPEVRSLVGRIRVARRWKNVDIERQARDELDRLLARRHLREAKRLFAKADAGGQAAS